MSFTTETLLVFVLLMPGFVSSTVLNAIVVRHKNDRVTNVIEAPVFSFVVYSILTAFNYSPVSLAVTDKDFYRPVVSPEHLPLAIILSVMLALLRGFSMTKDWHMKILRKMKVTTRTARINTWLDVFIDRSSGVAVTYSDGRRLSGWPSYYSDDLEEGLLYLRNPAWINENDEYTELGIHGILLTKKDSIESIMFMEDATGR